jgi:hypothetical protein
LILTAFSDGTGKGKIGWGDLGVRYLCDDALMFPFLDDVYKALKEGQGWGLALPLFTQLLPIGLDKETR